MKISERPHNVLPVEYHGTLYDREYFDKYINVLPYSVGGLALSSATMSASILTVMNLPEHIYQVSAVFGIEGSLMGMAGTSFLTALVLNACSLLTSEQRKLRRELIDEPSPKRYRFEWPDTINVGPVYPDVTVDQDTTTPA